MERRRLGQTDMVVSRIGLGTIPIIRQSKWRAVRIINKALDLGVNFIDTARAYEDSEEKIGEVMKTRRSECFLSSKTHFRSASETMDALDTTLRNLNTDYLDLYMLHDISSQDRWDQVFAPKGALEAVKKAQKQGKVRYVGVSAHNVPMLMDLVKMGEFSVILTCYNFMTLEPEYELIPLAQSKGVGVLVMKPNVGGIPFRFIRPGKDGQEPQPSDIQPKDTLRFVLSNPGVDCALVGPKLVKEMVENYRTGNNYQTMDEQERQSFIKSGEDLFPKMPLCQGCGYCEPCPAGIPISKIMLLFQNACRLFFEWPRNRKEYHKLRPDVSACTDCGTCEERCPQKLNIRERLRTAKKRLDHPV